MSMLGHKHSEGAKRKMSEKKMGDKSPMWKGGLWKDKKYRAKNLKEWRHKKGISIKTYAKEKMFDIKEYKKQWNKANKELKQIYNNRRRFLELSAGGSFTLGEWDTLKAQYNWTCPSCERPEPQISLTIDHVIPISKGGSDNIENIQPLCQSCNSKKSTKIIKYKLTG